MTATRLGGLLLVVLGVLGGAGEARATGPSAQEIVERAREKSTLNLAGARAKLRLQVKEAGGATRERVMTTAAKKIDGRVHTVLRFLAPAEVAGVALRVVETPGAEAEQSLYLPKLRRVRKVAATQKSQAFMGTDLSFADLGGTGLVEGTYTRLPDAVVEGQPALVVEGKPAGASPYARVRAFVHPQLFVTLQVEFFDAAGARVKTYAVRRLKELQPGRFVAMESTMQAAGGGRTDITVEELELDAKLPDEEFTERALER